MLHSCWDYVCEALKGEWQTLNLLSGCILNGQRVQMKRAKKIFFLSLKIFSNMNIPGNRLLTEKDAMLRSCWGYVCEAQKVGWRKEPVEVAGGEALARTWRVVERRRCYRRRRSARRCARRLSSLPAATGSPSPTSPAPCCPLRAPMRASPNFGSSQWPVFCLKLSRNYEAFFSL